MLRLNLSITFLLPHNQPLSYYKMYNFHFSNNEQPTLPPYYVNPYIMQQLLVSQWHWQANTMPSGWGFVDYGLPFYQWPIPVYYQHCQWQQALNSDPSRYNQSSIHSSRFHMTEPLPTYNIARESLGMIQEDRPTGIHPGHAWIGPNFNTGVGEVWRTPSKNPMMIDCNLT